MAEVMNGRPRTSRSVPPLMIPNGEAVQRRRSAAWSSPVQEPVPIQAEIERCQHEIHCPSVVDRHTIHPLMMSVRVRALLDELAHGKELEDFSPFRAVERLTCLDLSGLRQGELALLLVDILKGAPHLSTLLVDEAVIPHIQEALRTSHSLHHLLYRAVDGIVPKEPWPAFVPNLKTFTLITTCRESCAPLRAWVPASVQAQIAEESGEILLLGKLQLATEGQVPVLVQPKEAAWHDYWHYQVDLVLEGSDVPCVSPSSISSCEGLFTDDADPVRSKQRVSLYWEGLLHLIRQVFQNPDQIVRLAVRESFGAFRNAAQLERFVKPFQNLTEMDVEVGVDSDLGQPALRKSGVVHKMRLSPSVVEEMVQSNAHLEKLTIRGWHCLEGKGGDLLAGIAGRSSGRLTELRLEKGSSLGGQCISYAGLITLMQENPQLHTLHLHFSNFVHEDEDLPDIARAFPKNLKTLKVTFASGDRVALYKGLLKELNGRRQLPITLNENAKPLTRANFQEERARFANLTVVGERR